MFSGSNAMQRLRARSRKACPVFASASVATKTLKIGTRGSPLALAQAYMTRDLLKVRAGRPAALRARAPSRNWLPLARGPPPGPAPGAPLTRRRRFVSRPGRLPRAG